MKPPIAPLRPIPRLIFFSRWLQLPLYLALISISSIHLLKTFIDAAQKDTHTILWQVAIHVAFLVSALVMAWVDRIVSHAHPHGEAADAH